MYNTDNLNHYSGRLGGTWEYKPMTPQQAYDYVCSHVSPSDWEVEGIGERSVSVNMEDGTGTTICVHDDINEGIDIMVIVPKADY